MIIPVENQATLKAIQTFLAALLETGAVDLLLVPMRTPRGAVSPTLVSNPAFLVHADPLAPVMPVNGATLAGKLSVRQPRAKVGVVLRACELRALIELTKMQQANLDDLILIAVDCVGTYSVPNFQRKEKGNGSGPETEIWKALFQAANNEPEKSNENLRPACQICEQQAHAIRPEKDIAIELFGHNLGQELHITLPDALAAQIRARLGLAETKEAGSDRASVLERLVAARTTQRDVEFAAIRDRLEGEEGLAGIFAACIRCHNCMTVCPICYCKQCVFKSAVFDHEPMQFVNWARQKGAFRMPPDTTLFHMTRLNHMSLSCIGCGMCTEACPSELPVGMVFRAIGQRVQAEFAYTPGKNLEDPLPLVTFKADEWEKVGE